MLGGPQTIYTRLANTAMTLLANYGGPVTLLQAGPSVYDPTKGKNTPTTTTYMGTGAMMDFSLSAPSVTTVRGTEVQQGDKMLYMGMQGTLAGVAVQMPQPNTDDTIIFQGTAYNILATTTTDPSGTGPVVHALHVRGVSSG
jgi:hypothetical protein